MANKIIEIRMYMLGAILYVKTGVNSDMTAAGVW